MARFDRPDGAVYREIHNLAAFARAHGIKPIRLWRVATGTQQQADGSRRIPDAPA